MKMPIGATSAMAAQRLANWNRLSARLLRRWTQHSLEIRLREPIPGEIVDALDAQRRRQPPAVGVVRKKSYYPSPVTNPDGRTLRILWQGRYDMVKPSIDAAVQTLSQYVAQHTEELLDRSKPEEMSAGEFDNLVLNLCESGAKIDAVKLLKRHRGFTTTSAKQFVDELTNCSSAT